MMAKEKKIVAWNGLDLGAQVFVADDVPEFSKPREVRQLGKVGFLIKGSLATYYWHDEGKTWRRGS